MLRNVSQISLPQILTIPVQSLLMQQHIAKKAVMLATTFVLIPLLFQSEKSFGIVQTVVLESATTGCSITDLKHIVVICVKVNILLLTIIGEIGFAHKGIILFHLCL